MAGFWEGMISIIAVLRIFINIPIGLIYLVYFPTYPTTAQPKKVELFRLLVYVIVIRFRFMILIFGFSCLLGRFACLQGRIETVNFPNKGYQCETPNDENT